jgi:hypothetical protein
MTHHPTITLPAVAAIAGLTACGGDAMTADAVETTS